MSKSKIVKVYVGMFLIVSFFVLFSISMAFASEWIKTFGGPLDDWANSIQQTADGGYIVAGWAATLPIGLKDAWVLKLDGSGNVQWQKIYGGQFDDMAKYIQQTTDGGYIVAGDSPSFSGDSYSHFWILKLDENGDVQWQNIYGGYGTGYEYAQSIQQTTDGGYIVAGFSYSFWVCSGDYFDFWVLKLDGNGNVQWQKTYGGACSKNEAYSIRQTSDGGYIVAGETYPVSIAGSTDVWVLKLDGNGNVQWQKIYGGPMNDTAHSIQQTLDGGYIVAGSNSYVLNNIDQSDAWVLKLDGSGNVQWQKIYGGPLDDWANSIRQTSDGEYVVAGFTNHSSYGGNAWVLKLDGNGKVQWQKIYGGPMNDMAHSIQQTLDGGYVMTGNTGGDAWVLKLDGNGEIPYCAATGTSYAVVNDTNAIITTTNVIGIDSYVSPLTSTASTSNTNAVVKDISCSGTGYIPMVKCTLIPDKTAVARGGTLGIQATVTNSTGDVQVSYFATRVTKPYGRLYPSSRYLVGPITVILKPYESKSKLFSQYIPPYTTPLGIYTYYGYVSAGGIYDKCQFQFTVTE